MPTADAVARIALIHAFEESVRPGARLSPYYWPEAFPFHLLDAALAVDRGEAGRRDEAMILAGSSL